MSPLTPISLAIVDLPDGPNPQGQLLAPGGAHGATRAERSSRVRGNFARLNIRRIGFLLAVGAVGALTQLASGFEGSGYREVRHSSSALSSEKPAAQKRPSAIVNYTAIGDSLAFGTGATTPATGGYVPVYKSFLEADTGDTVVLDNRGIVGFTSANLLNAVLTDGAMRTSLQNANVITVNIGGNDLAPARVQYKTLTCGGVDGQDCLRSARDTLIANWNSIVAELLVLRASPAVKIRVIDVYNPFVAADRTADTFPDDEGLTDLEVLRSYLNQVNAHIAASATANGFALGRVARSFNGVSGDFDAGVGFGLLSGDFFHPNDLGHQVIAQQIRTGITPCLVQPNNIAAWYKGDGNGNDVFNLNNGTAEGGLGFGGGLVGQGFNLDGGDDSVLIPNLNLGDSYTIELWINPAATPGGSSHLVSNASSSSSFGALYLKSNLSLEYRQGGVVRATTSSGIVPVNAFTHIAITRDATDGRTRIYRNAVLRATSGVFAASYNNQLRVGFAVSPSDSRFEGVIDEVALYSRALSPTEIQAIFNADGDGKCAPGQRVWDGGGLTNNWSDAANWSGDVPPGTMDTAVFNSASAKTSTINTHATVKGVQINTGHVGTISTAPINASLTVGGAGFVQNAGQTNLSPLTVNSDFSLNGGTANLALTLTGNFSHLLGGTFTGSLTLSGATQIVEVGTTETFSTLVVNAGEVDLSNDSFIVTNMTLSGGCLNNGQINVEGVFFSDGNGCGSADGGSATIRIVGDSARNVNFNKQLPNIIFDAPNAVVNPMLVTGTSSVFRSLTVENGNPQFTGGRLYKFTDSYQQIGGTVSFGDNSDLEIGQDLLLADGSLIIGDNCEMTIAGDFNQPGGTFSSGNSVLVFDDVFITGATFTSTSGDLFISGFFEAHDTTFNHNTGTVTFDSPDQSLITITGNQLVFNNLTFNAPDVLFLESDGTAWMTAVGAMNFSQGGFERLFTSPAIPSFRSEGNVTMTGFNFNENFDLRFQGTANQTFTQSGGFNFDGWTVDKSLGTVTLNQNTAISTLFLANGTITTGANVLSATAITRSAGFVIGNLSRDFTATGTKTFDVGTANGYSPVTVSATTVATPSSLTVSATQGAHPLLSASLALGRFWTLTESGDLTATLTFSYLDPTDISGNESGYRIFRISGGIPTGFPNSCPSSPCVNTTSNTATIAGVSEFSDWSLGEPGAPTAIELTQFAAVGYDDGTLLEWETGFEVDNLGFNIYRDDAGARTLLNHELLAGSALVAGSTALSAGRAYAFWVDSNVAALDSAFWLEDIDLNGKASWHGPVFAKLVGGKPPARSLAESLSRVGQPGFSGATHAFQTFAALPNSAQPGSSFALLHQSTLASSPAVKILVNQPGWYRITQAELIYAGLDPLSDPRTLRLFVDGCETPIYVAGELDGRFDATDAIEFYGLGLNTPSTDTRVYWLIAGPQAGRRITKQPSSIGYPSGDSFPYTVERRDRTIYFSALRNGDDENFFGSVISSTATVQRISLSNLAQATRQNAFIDVSLQGVTNIAHQVSLFLNGSHIGHLAFAGQSLGHQSFQVPHSLLREGENLLLLQSINGPTDISLVDSIRLTYQHLYQAVDDFLVLTATPGETSTISRFSSKHIRVFDVTDDRDVRELAVSVDRSMDGYAATFTCPGAGFNGVGSGVRKLLALTELMPLRSASVSANTPSRLRDPANSADFIIISPSSLTLSLYPLVSLRTTQGLNTVVVQLDDIFDEFSFGIKSPQAIRDFLHYTASTWKTIPRFLLFAGDASYDSRNYLRLGEYDLTPTKLIDTAYLETASDDWFSDFNRDGVADIATGRLPGRSALEIEIMVAKIIGYERSDPANEALLVADANDGFDFEQSSSQLSSLIHSSLRITQINRGRVDAEKARNSLFESLLRRQFLVNYLGHGSANQWRASLLTNDDALKLLNQHLPLFVMMTCLNGYFHDSAADSLAESLIKAAHGGASAVWASSGMTTPAEQALMNQALYRELFSQGSSPTKPAAVRLGEAIQKAKAAVNDEDIRRTWILLGDPTMRPR